MEEINVVEDGSLPLIKSVAIAVNVDLAAVVLIETFRIAVVVFSRSFSVVFDALLNASFSSLEVDDDVPNKAAESIETCFAG